MKNRIDLSGLDSISKEVRKRLSPASLKILKALLKLKDELTSGRS